MANVAVSSLSKQTHDELAVTYAALILHDEGLQISSQNLVKLINASGNKVDSFWPSMFAKALSGRSVSDFLLGGGDGGQAAPAPAAAGAQAPAGKTEAKKDDKKKAPEPPKEEEDVGMGGLFD
eukprot:TRINITY_DN0_c2000_g1_i3.p1 TRINITY_DN0_c2000_g1~~TRINITY_DN0_c2000_g1_i3.p1  ORF type:complete len:123 (+),score=42.08 TRINITY_DN0_c2000_g1_i3:42-410(+)